MMCWFPRDKINFSAVCFKIFFFCQLLRNFKHREHLSWLIFKVNICSFSKKKFSLDFWPGIHNSQFELEPFFPAPSVKQFSSQKQKKRNLKLKVLYRTFPEDSSPTGTCCFQITSHSKRKFPLTESSNGKWFPKLCQGS